MGYRLVLIETKDPRTNQSGREVVVIDSQSLRQAKLVQEYGTDGKGEIIGIIELDDDVNFSLFPLDRSLLPE